jgi:hypothetical protein
VFSKMPLKTLSNRIKLPGTLFERISANMKKAICLICVALIAALAGSCAKEAKKTTAESVKPKITYTADWESLKNRNPAPDWFREIGRAHV